MHQVDHKQQGKKEIQGQHRAKSTNPLSQVCPARAAESSSVSKAEKSQEGNQRIKRISDPQHMSSTPGAQALGSGPQTTTAEDNQLQSIGRTVVGVQVTLLSATIGTQQSSREHKETESLWHMSPFQKKDIKVYTRLAKLQNLIPRDF